MAIEILDENYKYKFQCNKCLTKFQCNENDLSKGYHGSKYIQCPKCKHIIDDIEPKNNCSNSSYNILTNTYTSQFKEEPTKTNWGPCG